MDELRSKAAEYLAGHHWGVMSAPVPPGNAGQVTWAAPARYCPVPIGTGQDALTIECLVPRWADLGYLLSTDPRALLIVPDLGVSWLRWLECHGVALPVDLQQSAFAATTGLETDGRYLAIRIMPRRIDLIDESRGWGARETLEF